MPKGKSSKIYTEWKCSHTDEVPNDKVSREQLVSWYMFRRNRRAESQQAKANGSYVVKSKGITPKKASAVQSFSYSYQSYCGISASPSAETLLMSNNNNNIQPTYYTDRTDRKYKTNSLPGTQEIDSSFDEDDDMIEIDERDEVYENDFRKTSIDETHEV